MTNLPYIIGQIYKRSTIHDQFGGNRQSGISPSAEFPYIFIFSGKSGHQHGYNDQWENENVFSYTGEGQVGDMKLTKNNLLLPSHKRVGKRIFLFTQEAKSYVKYEGELEFIDIDYYVGPDREGKDRTAIKFFFKRARKILSYQHDAEESLKSLVQEPNNRLYVNTPNETERQGLVTSRVGQGAYRKSILYRWHFKCAVTSYPNHGILIASHIVPWRDATNDERLDVNNGILLSPTYDALFDRHLISFENNGKIILSNSIKPNHYQILGVTGKESIKDFSKDNYPYLTRHRKSLV